MRPRMKSIIILSVLGFSLALNVSLTIGYFRGSAGKTNAPSAHATEGDYCLLDSLKLDTEQLQQLATMRRKMHKKRSAYWQRASGIKGELAEAICAVQTNRAVLDAQLERFTENQAAMQRAVAEHLRGVNAMLRPEQREGFRTLLRTKMFRGIRSSRSKPAGVP